VISDDFDAFVGSKNSIFSFSRKHGNFLVYFGKDQKEFQWAEFDAVES